MKKKSIIEKFNSLLSPNPTLKFVRKQFRVARNLNAALYRPLDDEVIIGVMLHSLRSGAITEKMVSQPETWETAAKFLRIQLDSAVDRPW